MANFGIRRVKVNDVDRAVGEAFISNVVIQPNPEIDGVRVSFRLAPDKETVVELRAQLMQGDKPLSEVWIYRWTA